MTAEAKNKAAEAKARADDAFRRKDFMTAVDAYTQVHIILATYFIYYSPRGTGSMTYPSFFALVILFHIVMNKKYFYITSKRDCVRFLIEAFYA